MIAITYLAGCALALLVLYLFRDKTEWVYEGDRRHDKANPKRVQVWDDSYADGWSSGEWVDA